MVGEFFVPFQQNIKIKDKEINKEDLVIIGDSDELCDLCGKKMVKKLGKFGTFLSCSDFPTCKGIKSLDGESQEEIENKAQTEEFKEMYKPAPQTDDGRNFLLKKGRYGEFWAHPDYPKVKDARPLEYTDKKMKELFGVPPKSKDGKKMLLRSGKFGHFWAHPDYRKDF
jgi:DNA topoisomerase-1